MGEIIKFPGQVVVATSNVVSAKCAKSFQIEASSANYDQYGNTVKAYKAAGMTFGDIANAADSLGDKVIRKETDAPFADNPSGLEKKGDVVEDGDQIMAWQARGERIAVVHQLAAPVQGNEVAVASGNLTVGQNQQNSIEVLEGIQVSQEKIQALPEQKTEENPFLKTPAIVNKAA